MHNNAISLLKRYNPKDIREKFVKEQMLELLAVCNNCFERSSAIGHFTSSAWLIDKTTEKFLLMHHAKYNAWTQLGGHCDGDNNLLAVAIKEAQEESGLTAIEPVYDGIFDIDIFLIPKIKDEIPHYHFDVRFLLQHTEETNVVANEESTALQWFDADLNKMPTNKPNIMRMFYKWFNWTQGNTLRLADKKI